MRVVFDIETNGLTDPDKIWCVVCYCLEEDTYYTFERGRNLADFTYFAAKVTEWIGHNIIDYDTKHLTRLLGIEFDKKKVTDTLVLSHLLKYRLDDGHSLEAWGDRLGIAKVGLDIDFSSEDQLQEIVKRCKRDVEINLLLYKFLIKKLDNKHFKEAIDTEHEMAWICRDMHENGFAFDHDGAVLLYKEIETEVNALDSQIKAAFPPISRVLREYTPKETKYGTISRNSVPRNWDDLTLLSPGATFVTFAYEEFNPGSAPQIKERLEGFWDPVDRTDGYIKAQRMGDKEKLAKLDKTAWKINEENLSTLSESAPPAAKLLVRRLMLGARLRTLTEWMSAYNAETGRVHGRFNSIGTYTHRMSHRDPNMGNIAASKSIKYNSPDLKKRAIELGGRMRSLWRAEDKSYLVGTDMESAHLRIFAHLIDDDNFKKALLTGDKKDGSDPHSTNKRALGEICPDRDRAKTFIFTFLNGGGAGKTASIFGCSVAQAREAIENFIQSYPGLKTFKEKDAKTWAKRGYFKGPDGRLVVNDSDHHMLAGYLQNYEATMMKKANIIWRKALDKRGIKYKQVNLVHDEYVTEVYGTPEQAWLVGLTQSAAIRLVGKMYGIRIKMAGDWKVGRTWLEVH